MAAVQVAYCDHDGKIGIASKNPRGGTVLAVAERNKLRKLIDREAPEWKLPGHHSGLSVRQLCKVVKDFQQKLLVSLDG